jgi:uncharacterized membrane protein
MSSQPPTDDPFVQRLPAEVAAWQAENLLPAETARVILARYGLVPGESVVTLRRSKIVAVFTVLAAILIGVGVILVMSANWEQIPRFMRLAILMAVTLGFYYFGYRLAYERRTYPIAGAALLLIGSLIWGASIFLIGQMYHLGGGEGGEGGETTGTLYWFIGVLPLAYILRSRLQLGLALLIGTTWLMLAQSSVFDSPYGQIVVPRFLAVGALLYALGLAHDMWERTRVYAGVLKTFGVVYALVTTCTLSYRDFWSIWGWYGQSYARPSEALWLALASAAIVLAALSAVRSLTASRRDPMAATEGLCTAALGAIAIVAIALAASTFLAHQHHAYHAGPIGPPIAFNLILLALELGVISLGWFRHQPGWINLGLVMFGLQVVTRYFDIFGSLISGGLFFIGIGVILLVCGFALEKARRRLVATSERREGSI